MVDLLSLINSEATLLRGNYPDMIEFLHRQGDLSGETIGNRPTDQEASFAVEAEKLGRKFLKDTDEIPGDGRFYKYQVNNGLYSKTDFVLYEGTKIIKIELKSSKGESVVLNDGWFYENIIHIFSYKSKKVEKICIALGQEVYEECDNIAWNTIRETIKNMNKEAKNTKFLKIYNRLANQYSCKQFTPDFTQERFNSVIKFLE